MSVQIIKVRGRSMEPAIADGTWVISWRAAYRRNMPQRFHVVRLEDPRMAGHWILKRIVGLPGEEVELRGGGLFVNGSPVEDSFSYCPDTITGNHRWWPSDNEFVVLGDNRAASTDSRDFGVVKLASFRGRVRE